ncbi:MAG: glycoside hydrolase family 20 zincin-like fold domain-containing protein [Sphaerochaetaceae bacterium]
MCKIFPEPKVVNPIGGYSQTFKSVYVNFKEGGFLSAQETEKILSLRFNASLITISADKTPTSYIVNMIPSLKDVTQNDIPLLKEQGYQLVTGEKEAVIRYETKEGLNYALSTFFKLLESQDEVNYSVSQVDILDYPSIPVRAVAPTFSWYAGYGRIGFDSQLFGEKEWIAYLHDCVDQKINQLNMVMYGYWPFYFEKYPETIFKDIPVSIWNAETERWIKIHYSHPNIEDDFFERFIAYAHDLGIKIFAYVGLNSYNGGYSIRHPEKRMKAPQSTKFLNDFDSLCLSDEENVEYIIESMKKIASLGVDGFTLEESEEGFWFCECEACKERWHKHSTSPGDAKHKANMWLLNKIYKAIREINNDAVIGIRAFRQPPLEKDVDFLKEYIREVPSDINLFWAPALYVPETEFDKWISVFGEDRIWGRDSESNSITSTMGRLYRIFESNVIRYEDEANVQVIERDIEQHISSVQKGVHGINGFMFEIYGYFMHQWAHANYGWGSTMDKEEFFRSSCVAEFGEDLGKRILYILKHIVTIHESQIPLYTTPFPFQKNKMTKKDIPAIEDAIAMYPGLLSMLHEVMEELESSKRLSSYVIHFKKIENALRRNRVIYDLVLAALEYEEETDPDRKDKLLDDILELNEKDFSIAKEMFFDINPVSETGVKSCMFPYHEMKRLIHNIRNEENRDDSIICSGIEALGWLWL